MSKSETLQKNIIEVRISTSKGSCKTSIPPEFLGIKPASEDGKSFVHDYFDTGSFLFFPKDIFKKVTNLSSKLTRRIERLSLAKGLNGFYINIKDYQEVKLQYTKVNEEFELIKSDLIKNNETYKKLFENKTKKFLNELNVADKKKILDILVDKYPTASMIESSFSLNLIVQGFPIYSEGFVNDKDLAEDIIKSEETRAIQIFHDIETTLLIEAFGKILNYIKRLEDKSDECNSLASRTLGGINTFIKGLEQNNEIIRSKSIALITDALKRILIEGNSLKVPEPTILDDPLSVDQYIEELEVVLGYIYNCSTYLGVSDQLPKNEMYNTIDLEVLNTVAPLEKFFVLKKSS